MAIKITINSSEIKNPLLRFLASIVLLGIFAVLCIFVLFILLPVLWVLLASVLLLAMVSLAAAPMLRSQYKIIVLERQKLENKK